jgi:predicted transcriptional regulator
MVPKTGFAELRKQAIALRRAGKSRSEIKRLLAIGSNSTLNEALSGEPPPEWTLRPNAKDGQRQAARELRQRGLDYQQIAAELGVSKSSVSLWVRDLPRPPRLSYEECRKRHAEAVRRYWAAERPARAQRREAVRLAAIAQAGTLSEREILIAGAIAYWCEGSKNKPHRRGDRVAILDRGRLRATAVRCRATADFSRTTNRRRRNRPCRERRGRTATGGRSRTDSCLLRARTRSVSARRLRR